MANTQLSDAAHVLVYIAMHQLDEITSEKIANSVMTDPTMVRRIMSKLNRAGLLKSNRGIAKPEIIRPLEKITLKDIYHAVSTAPNFLNVDYETSKTCNVGSIIPMVMGSYYEKIQTQTENEMAKITLAKIIKN